MSSRVLKDFSQLPPHLQERYYNFFVDNDVHFSQNDDGDYVATMRVFDPGHEQTRPGGHDDSVSRSTTASTMRAANAGSMSATKPNTSANRSSAANSRTESQRSNFDTKSYPRFCSLIQQRGFLKAKQRPVTWLLKLIEEIYDERYAHDVNDTKSDEICSSKPNTLFPVFVNELFCKKYGLKSLVEQVCWDLVVNVQQYRKSYQEVEIFGRFLDEFYDPDDLLFFLYVRSIISQQHLKLAKHYPTGLPNAMSKVLSDRMCMNVVRIVFGEDPDMLLDDFLGAIDENLVFDKTRRERVIHVQSFLTLALSEYHTTRPQPETRQEEPFVPSVLEPVEEPPYDEMNPTQDEWSERLDQLEAARHLAIQEQQVQLDEDKHLESRILEAMKASGFKSGRPEIHTSPSPKIQNVSESPHRNLSPQLTLQSPLGDVFSFSVSPTSTEAPYTPASETASPIPDQVNLQLIMELKQCLVQDTQSYLDTIMNAADNLPSNARQEIRTVVETRLQAKVAAALSELLEGSDNVLLPNEYNPSELQHQVNMLVSSMVDAAVESSDKPISELSDFEAPKPTTESLDLAHQYQQLLKSQLRALSKSDPNSATRSDALCTFSRTLLGSPELRQEIEPLIVFLVIFATKQIEVEEQ